jgi:hypothetical protein
VPNRIECCPSCSGNLEIRELYCPVCDIQLRGRFNVTEHSPFSQLNDEQEAFLRLFVLSRGNLSDVERSLGVSYPTVRAKLDDLIAAVSAVDQPGTQPVAESGGSAGSRSASDDRSQQPLSRTEILARVADGRLSTEEGMTLLKQLSGGS